jgi:hypothetical protein
MQIAQTRKIMGGARTFTSAINRPLPAIRLPRGFIVFTLP